MRLILSLLVTIMICTSVHSNTIYRRYRQLDVPVVPSVNEEIVKERVYDELKKDQIPVHIEIVEPVVILKEKVIDVPIESGRNVENIEPIVAAEIVEKVEVKDDVINANIKSVVVEPNEQSRSVEPVVVERVAAAIAPEGPVVVQEVIEQVVVPVENLRNSEKSVKIDPVVPAIVDGSVRNVEPVVIVEEAVVPVVVVPVVPIESSRNVDPIEASRNVEPVEASRNVEPVESSRNIEAIEVGRNVEPTKIVEKVEEVKKIDVVDEVKKEDPVEIVVKVEPVVEVKNIDPVIEAKNVDPVVSVEPVEAARNVEPAVIPDLSRKVEQLEVIEMKPEVVENVKVEEVKKIEQEDEEALPVIPLEGQTLIAGIDASVAEKIVPKEKLRSIVPAVEEQVKSAAVEKKDEKVSEVKVENKPNEEVLSRSVDEEKPKTNEVVEKVEEEKIVEIKKDEIAVKAIPEVVVSVPKDEEKVEQLIVNENEPVESVRQTAESSTQNVIQSLLQNNPLTNLIDRIRPPTTAPLSSNTDSNTPDQPPNIIQQITTGLQGIGANVQGFFNPQSQQSATNDSTTQRPFGFITSLFQGQTGSQANPPTGGNVPPNPIQGPIQGILGFFNGNRLASSTAAPIVSSTTLGGPLNDKIDALKGSDEINSNETYESEPEIYVGDEDVSASTY